MPAPDSPSFIGARMRCCNIYVRLYLDETGLQYTGRCYRCGRPTQVSAGRVASRRIQRARRATESPPAPEDSSQGFNKYC